MTTKKTEQHIKLAEISLSPLNPRKFIDEEALAELATSIRQYGVIQAIVIRPVEKGYELVAGERRYRAATLAGLKEIPATIKELTDSEALEIAIIENLQRKDVHPMNEAVAFKQMQDQYSFGIAEIAGRLGRSEKYIAQRLKLNDLAEGFQKMFFDGQILLGHALEFCKLVLKDQEFIIKQINDLDYKWRDIDRLSIFKVKELIVQNFRRPLNKALFDVTDQTLIKKVGACSECPFNTACAGLLFSDEEKENASCTNPSCYEQKTNHTFDRNLKAAIDDPDTVLLQSYSSNDDKIVKSLKADGHTLYQEYEDYDTVKDKGKGVVKGFHVNGYQDKGKTVLVRIRPKATSKGEDASTSAQIDAINQKLKRGRELDAEKVHTNVGKTLFELPQFKTDGPLDQNITEAELKALYFFVYTSLDYIAIREVQKHLGLKENCTHKDMLERIDTMTQGEFAYILRNLIRGKYKNSLPPWPEAKAVRKIAEFYIPEEIANYELDHVGICERREAKLNKRLEDLKAELPEQKEKPVKVKSVKSLLKKEEGNPQ